MFDIIKQIYLNSIFYDKKISPKLTSELKYKPSSYLLSSIVKIRTKKFNIENFLYDDFWTNKKLNQKQLQKLSNFNWLFSLDLKSSNESVQLILKKWIEKNYKYNSKNWDFEITSKELYLGYPIHSLLTIIVLINIKRILTQLYLNKLFT